MPRKTTYPSPQKHDFLLKSIPESRLSGNAGCKSGWHEHLEIKYILSGQADIRIEDENIRARPGDIILTNPYEIHSISTRPGESVAYHFLMVGMDYPLVVDGEGFDLRRLFLDQRVRLSNHIRSDYAADLLCRLTEEAAQTRPYGEIAVRGLMLTLFAVLFRDAVSDAPYGDRWGERIRFYSVIAPAVRMIHDRYSEKITGDMLAEACRMSRAHFCRTFREAMGVSPLRYQTEYRLLIAENLLKGGSVRIAEAARMAGFEDEAYFSRCYKKSRGVPPSAKKAQSSKQ